jgi:hypothetical protein
LAARASEAISTLIVSGVDEAGDRRRHAREAADRMAVVLVD